MEHISYINKKPGLSGKSSTPDGAVNGNGDLAVILGNSENGLRIYISKCDLWEGIEHHDKGGLKPLGYIDIDLPAGVYENYRAEQDMDKGEIRCSFEKDEQKANINLRVCKSANYIMLETEGTVPMEPLLKVYGGETSGKKGESEKDGVRVIFRSFAGEECAYPTHCFAAMAKIDEGTYCVSVVTNHDIGDDNIAMAGAAAIKNVREMNPEKYERLKCRHYVLWEEFRQVSSFTTTDPELEMGWYASQYILAICTGNKKFPPGLFANFITVEHPAWHSDYHLNYNYQAPFYGAVSSNHVEFTDCYMTPLEEFMPKGSEFAQKLGCRGVLYPVAIEPKGICSELVPDYKYSFERLFLGQKNNQIHPADIPVFRWNATKDLEYAKEHLYPYLNACIEFFEDYVKYEDGRYSVCDDAAHEVPVYKEDFDPKKPKYRFLYDKNNTVTLGMLRLGLKAAIEIGGLIGEDPAVLEKRKRLLEKLAPYPTFTRHFKKVYRYTQQGQAWNGTGDVGLQHIYPGGAVGLLSDKKDYDTALNTFMQKKKVCWKDGNAVTSFFPMAARLGVDPEEIITELKKLNKRALLPNMLFLDGCGGLEFSSIFAATLNEMVLQSFQGVIWLFPDWSRKLDVRFENLRADGAFIVTAEMKGGKVTEACLRSEAGGKAIIANPYEKAIVVHRDRKFECSDRLISVDTVKNDLIFIYEER